MSSIPLPKEKVFSLTFSLKPESPPLCTQAQVIHSAGCPVEDTEHNNFAMWIEFLDPEPVKAHLIDAFAEEPPE